MELTPEHAASAVSKFGLMSFFPSGDPEVRAALVSILLEMVETKEQLDWLVNRALQLHGKWPGVAELRALYCSRWKPRDGIETYSLIYPDGIPSERRDAPPAPVTGETRDPELRSAIHLLAEKKKSIPRRGGSRGEPAC